MEALRGKNVIKDIKERVKDDVQFFKEKNICPKLGIIQVGNRADDESYKNSIIKRFNSVGIDVEVFNYEENITMEEFVKNLKIINENDKIHGILIFRPLPKQLDYNTIKNLINPEKDIDCMNPINLEKVFEGDMDGFVPCTPKAVIEILKYYEIPLKGANVAIINRSMVVGKPLSMMFLNENSTVTICHSKTEKLSEITSKADIVVTAIGKARQIGKEYFNPNSIVIDVSINTDEEGKLCGDVDYDNVKDDVKAITPVPGGVGGVTSTILLTQLIIACKKFINNEE